MGLLLVKVLLLNGLITPQQLLKMYLFKKP